MQRLLIAMVLNVGLAYGAVAMAQNAGAIYRCGNQYSSQPCQNTGVAQEVVQTQDPLPAANGQSGKAKTYAQQAELLERENAAQERQAARSAQHQPGQFKARENAEKETGVRKPDTGKSGKKSTQKKKKAPDYFTAGVPKNPSKP